MLTKKIYSLTALDIQIAKTRKELLDLYNKRSTFISFKRNLPIKYVSSSDFSIKITVVDNWVKDEYEKLRTAWIKYNIPIPTYFELEKQIKKAYTEIAKITGQKPELKNKLSLLLVPPKQYLGFPISENLRQYQKFIDHGDFVGASLPATTYSDNWRLFISYTGLSSIYLPTTPMKTAKSLYRIAGYDTRGMGQIEYAALTLQHPHIIDRGTTTLLLKDYDAGELIPSAGFSRGAYRFLYTYAGNYLEDYRYRPTVEIL